MAFSGVAWPGYGKMVWPGNEDVTHQVGSQQDSTADFARGIGVTKKESGGVA